MREHVLYREVFQVIRREKASTLVYEQNCGNSSYSERNCLAVVETTPRRLRRRCDDVCSKHEYLMAEQSRYFHWWPTSSKYWFDPWGDSLLIKVGVQVGLHLLLSFALRIMFLDNRYSLKRYDSSSSWGAICEKKCYKLDLQIKQVRLMVPLEHLGEC